MRPQWLVGFTLLCAFASEATVRAAETSASPALGAALKSLFADSWEKSADGMAAADRNHRAAKAASPSDPRVDFALALVQWRYLRYTDALKTLDQLATNSPNYLPALQARAYLMVLMKKHSTALVQLEALQQAATTKLTAPEQAAQRREVVEFLGRIFGYYEGPAAGAISQSSVADARKRIFDSLSTDDREAFSEAFASVRDRFLQLDDDKRRTAADAKVDQERQKAEELQRLSAERALVEADKQSLQAQHAEIQKMAQDQVDAIDKQITPIETEYARINAQGAILRNQIAQLEITIGQYIDDANNTDDPALKNSLLAQANALSFQSRRLEIDYQTLDAAAAQLVGRRNALLQQRGQVVSRYEADAKRLGVQAAKLGRNEKRINVEQRKVQKPVSGFTPQVQDKTATTASVTTYVEFPLEREKMRILTSLE
ncbi:MAG: hypothetical protein JNK76_18175 [Planctomycetales bacterium]|nr:hypothetical protein [Planctomycetales bacterium]